MMNDDGHITRDAIARLVVEREQLVQANAALAEENDNLRAQLAARNAPVQNPE
jgi:hypothetical protein